MNNLASVLAVECCWVGSVFLLRCKYSLKLKHWSIFLHWCIFLFFFPFSLEYCPTLGQNEFYGPLGWPQMTLCFLTYCLFCHHNSTWLHLNKHVIYCTCRLESSEVICSHSEKTSFPYAACYTERVVGFARVIDFPKGYRTKLCTLLFTNLKSL